MFHCAIEPKVYNLALTPKPTSMYCPEATDQTRDDRHIVSKRLTPEVGGAVLPGLLE